MTPYYSIQHDSENIITKIEHYARKTKLSLQIYICILMFSLRLERMFKVNINHSQDFITFIPQWPLASGSRDAHILEPTIHTIKCT